MALDGFQLPGQLLRPFGMQRDDVGRFLRMGGEVEQQRVRDGRRREALVVGIRTTAHAARADGGRMYFQSPWRSASPSIP